MRLRSALFHPLNGLLLASAAASAATTGSVWPLAIGALSESLWLLWAMGQRDKTKPSEQQASLRAQQARLSQLTESLRQRFLEAERTAAEVRRWAEEGTDERAELLELEIGKVDRMVDGFLELAVHAARLERQAEGEDLDALAQEAADNPHAQDKLEAAAARKRAAAETEEGLQRIESSLRSLRDNSAGSAPVTDAIDAALNDVDGRVRAAREVQQLSR